MRLAKIVGALSLAADTAIGFSTEKVLRTVLVAMRLAERVGTSTEQQRVVFWATVLRFVGCTSFAHEAAAIAGGDDNNMRKTMVFADFDRPADVLGRLFRDVADGGALARAGVVARFVLDRDLPARYARSHCESGVFFARSLGLPGEVARALDVTDERFDGKGPRGVCGEELPFASRVADVADVLELFGWTGGVDLSEKVLRERRGRALDPALADAALMDLSALLSGLREGSVWDEYLAAEPTPIEVESEDLDRAFVALGRFADVKSVYTLTHSRRVSTIVEGAGRARGLADDQCRILRWAGSVHDLGRVAVATGTWDKRGPLNAVEWQRVRSHSYHTEAILLGAGFGELASIAGATHERGHGAGYHKAQSLDSVPLLAKILAAADVMVALGEQRPHRPAFEAPRAEKELRSLVEQGVLDARAAQAVLEGCGAVTKRKAAWPAGLSDREIDVVRLVAVGRTNKEIGMLLGVSPRTAQKHVMNVYDKLGLESRAGLALYAMEHGLLDED